MRRGSRHPAPGRPNYRAILTLLLIAAACSLTVPMQGCISGGRGAPLKPPTDIKPATVKMIATAYDNGPRSCNWKRNWYGRPVIASGPNKGKPKHVGVTASGTRAKPGTIAADTAHYPFGTIMHVEGYGYGVVEDTGGAIKGQKRIDLWFSSERAALEWGRKTVDVKVWMPPPRKAAAKPGKPKK